MAEIIGILSGRRREIRRKRRRLERSTRRRYKYKKTRKKRHGYIRAGRRI